MKILGINLDVDTIISVVIALLAFNLLDNWLGVSKLLANLFKGKAALRAEARPILGRQRLAASGF